MIPRNHPNAYFLQICIFPICAQRRLSEAFYLVFRVVGRLVPVFFFGSQLRLGTRPPLGLFTRALGARWGNSISSELDDLRPRGPVKPPRGPSKRDLRFLLPPPAPHRRAPAGGMRWRPPARVFGGVAPRTIDVERRSRSRRTRSRTRARARARGASEILNRRRGPARPRHRGEDAHAGRPRRSPRKATAGEEVSTGQEGAPRRSRRARVEPSSRAAAGASWAAAPGPHAGLVAAAAQRAHVFERCILEFGNAKILFKSHSTSYSTGIS